MGRVTNLLNAINVSEENTEELYGIFNLVNDFDLPVIRFFMGPGTSMIRQRINKPGIDFDKISDLYYPDACYITKYERANVPYQPMFYACSFPKDYGGKDVPPPRVVALMETSSFFKDKQSSGIERSTVSRWEVTEELELVALPFLADYTMACGDIRIVKEEWNNILKDSKVNADGLELIEYMANEIGKEFKSNVEYFKIANFVNYLLNINKKTKNVDGIMYPSVPGAGAGFNVAIRPAVADKKIQFISASLCHLLKKQDQSYLHVMNHSVAVENGIIVYEKMPMNEAELKMYNSYAEGVEFIN